MNVLEVLGKCRVSFVANSLITRNISVTALKNNMRWRLQNGYPMRWLDRGTLTDGVEFSYTDGRPSPYTSGQRARLLKQKEYTERIIYLLNGIEFAKQKKLDKINEAREEAEIAMTRKLKWKGIKTYEDEDSESIDRKLDGKKLNQQIMMRQREVDRINFDVECI